MKMMSILLCNMITSFFFNLNYDCNNFYHMHASDHGVFLSFMVWLREEMECFLWSNEEMESVSLLVKRKDGEYCISMSREGMEKVVFPSTTSFLHFTENVNLPLLA